MGGQRGGMVNEAGHFPEVCKKSVQAQAGDMQPPIAEDFFARRHDRRRSSARPRASSSTLGRLGFPDRSARAGRHALPAHRLGRGARLARGAALRAAAARTEAFFYSSGRSSNEAAFLLQLVARAYGTANIHNCSFYCHQASSVALAEVYGSGTASVVARRPRAGRPGARRGANPASNHPRLITQLVELRRRGGKVIVVNPLRELGLVRFRVPSDWRSMLFGSTVSDLYLQPHVGGDVALLKALLKGVVERGGVDDAFVAAHTSGWDGGRGATLAATSWDALLAACGVRARARSTRAVELLCAARRGIFCWAMGLTHHAHGVDNVLALANLALARGWLGRPGAGLLPIRGHSNVQGVGSVRRGPGAQGRRSPRALEELYGIDARAGAGAGHVRLDGRPPPTGRIRRGASCSAATSSPATPTAPGPRRRCGASASPSRSRPS